MIIAIPSTDHDHLADALVRDLAFTRAHVDAPVRDLLLALDPFVDSGVTLANMGPTPRLSSKLEQVGGKDAEHRWARLLNPPRGSGASPDRVAAEVNRLLDVLRGHEQVAPRTFLADVVLVGVEFRSDLDGVYRDATDPTVKTVAIDGRGSGLTADHYISPAGVVGEQAAIVAYVQELRNPRTTPLTEASAALSALQDEASEARELTDDEIAAMTPEEYGEYLKTIVLGHTETLHGEPLGEALSAPETSLTAPEN